MSSTNKKNELIAYLKTIPSINSCSISISPKEIILSKINATDIKIRMFPDEYPEELYLTNLMVNNIKQSLINEIAVKLINIQAKHYNSLNQDDYLNCFYKS